MLTKEEEIMLDEIERVRESNKLADTAQLYWFLDCDNIRGLSNALRDIGGY